MNIDRRGNQRYGGGVSKGSQKSHPGSPKISTWEKENEWEFTVTHCKFSRVRKKSEMCKKVSLGCVRRLKVMTDVQLMKVSTLAFGSGKELKGWVYELSIEVNLLDVRGV